MSEGRKISAVIFDMDGTLIDSFQSYYSTFNKGIRQFGLGPISKEFLASCMEKGLSLAEMLQKVFSFRGNESVIEKCRGVILEIVMKIEAEEIKPFPEISDLFKDLKKRGVRIGIATGRMSRVESELDRFRRFDLDRFIDAIVTSKEVERRKPYPDVIVECAKKMGVPVNECLVVGDTESDIQAAKRAGAISMVVCRERVLNGFIEKAEPDYIITNLNDLNAFLEKK